MSEIPIKPGSEPLKGRQELFCQLMAQNNTSASDAYRKAGYKGKNVDMLSSRLWVKVRTKARIVYLKRKIELKTQKMVLYTREQAIRDYERGMRLAKKHGQIGAYCTAVAGKVELCGLSYQPAQNPADRPLMTREELLEALAELDGVSEQAKIIQIQVNKRVG